MGWDRHKLLWDGNGTDKYVPLTTLLITHPSVDLHQNMRLKKRHEITVIHKVKTQIVTGEASNNWKTFAQHLKRK